MVVGYAEVWLDCETSRVLLVSHESDDDDDTWLASDLCM
jgi:hypothetical protein